MIQNEWLDVAVLFDIPSMSWLADGWWICVCFRWDFITSVHCFMLLKSIFCSLCLCARGVSHFIRYSTRPLLNSCEARGRKKYKRFFECSGLNLVHMSYKLLPGFVDLKLSTEIECQGMEERCKVIQSRLSQTNKWVRFTAGARGVDFMLLCAWLSFRQSLRVLLLQLIFHYLVRS